MARTDIKLSRTMILDAALDLTARDPDNAEAPTGTPITGQTLGNALGVDRSAIWRHFADRDDLILAANDRLLAHVSDSLDPATDPADRLRAIWTGTIASALAHPRIAAELGGRFNSGEHAITLIELTLVSFTELGLAADDAVTEYRAFIDVMLAYAAMVAQFSLVDPARSAAQEANTLAAVRALPETGHTLIKRVAPKLVGVDLSVSAHVFETYLAGVLARRP